MSIVDEYQFTEFPLLETERLILREAILSDAADIFVFRSDSYVQRFNSKPMVAVSEAEEMIERNRAMFDRQDGVIWAVCSPQPASDCSTCSSRPTKSART